MKLLNEVKNKIGSTERSGLINMLVKPLSTVLSLVYTPMLLVYLGDEKYGLWATVLSMITWINFFDVGIGNGLRNLLAKLLAQDNQKAAKKAVSTAYIMLTMIATTLLVILIVLSLLADWGIIFSTTIQMTNVMIITFVFICVNFVLALSNTLLYALHLAERVSVRNCFVQLANVVGLFIISQFTNQSLVAMAILFGATSSVLYIINSIMIFRNKPYLIPAISEYDRKMVAEICNVGMKFFVIQIMGLFLFTVDNLLITHYFGAVAATPFAITNKVFNTAYSVFAAFIVPYWSRTTVAIQQNNIKWVKESIRKVSFVGGLFIVGYIVLGVVFRPIVKIWLGRELMFETGLVPVMVVFYIVYTILAVECQFINGSSKIGVQLIVYIIIGVLNIPLSIFLGVGCSMGSVGIRLATTILVSGSIIVLGVNLKMIIKRLEKGILINT